MDVLLGLQWGYEGKGKVVDVLAARYGVVARFQGGPNAGHSLEMEGKRYVLHTIPSGVFRPGAVNIIGNGVVIDPIIFREEVRMLEAAGIDLHSSLYISRKAHLILPSHRALDAATEQAKGKDRVGSTLKGIGPTYMDKTGRNGLRVGDTELPDFKARYQALRDKHCGILAQYPTEVDFAQHEEEWFKGVECLREYQLADTEIMVNGYLDRGESVLAEGAQGTMLDIDFGSYPFVTSSSTVCAGACIGLGVAPARVGRVYGIFKAYCTRVGAGPFPTELHDATGELLREAGHEFGATTGRPRRCGWLDLVALRYAIMLNGVTDLIMTKADVLSGFDAVKVATRYQLPSGETRTLPYTLDSNLQPLYDECPGWQAPTPNASSYGELPGNLQHYVAYLERETGVPISMISVGPDRSQTIER